MAVTGKLVNMTPEEIISVDAKNNKGGMDPVMNKRILQTMQSQGAQVLKEGNTLFAFIPGKNFSVEVHTFNADPLEKFISNVKAFLRMLKKLGAKDVWTEFDDPKTKKIFYLIAPEFNFKVTKGDRYMAKAVLS
jgi:hypothetical protein